MIEMDVAGVDAPGEEIADPLKDGDDSMLATGSLTLIDGDDSMLATGSSILKSSRASTSRFSLVLADDDGGEERRVASLRKSVAFTGSHMSSGSLDPWHPAEAGAHGDFTDAGDRRVAEVARSDPKLAAARASVKVAIAGVL
ncbi:hypothetical protein HK101_001991 [Irineochytrium annulatum]|nr:hypothetical protein HK101_001991 [Irineochytrium annulatum]